MFTSDFPITGGIEKAGPSFSKGVKQGNRFSEDMEEEAELILRSLLRLRFMNIYSVTPSPPSLPETKYRYKSETLCLQKLVVS